MIHSNSTILFQGDSITDCGRNRDADHGPNSRFGLGQEGVPLSLRRSYLQKCARVFLLATSAFEPFIAPSLTEQIEARRAVPAFEILAIEKPDRRLARRNFEKETLNSRSPLPLRLKSRTA